MKNVLISVVFISLCFQGYCQKITGTVFSKFTPWDASVLSPVRGARVFFNGSLVSTVADFSGNFQLALPGDGMLPIVATNPDHEPLILFDYNKNNHIHFYLNPRRYALARESATIKMNSKQTRHVNLEIFKEQFLGTSAYASSCRILNERDLTIRYDPRTTLLKVSSEKPMIIVNTALGYRITYYLKKFEFTVNSQKMLCSGYYYFTDEPSLNKAEMELARGKRELAYFGSWMEFLRSLWSNSLDSSGYELRTSSNKKLTYDSLVFEANGSKYWKYKEPVTIYHFSKNNSTTVQTGEFVYFDKLGYCDTEGIDWRKSGEMSFQKLGDQLPFDYKINGKEKFSSPEAISK